MSTDERQCRKPGTNPDDWFAWPGSARAKRAQQLCAVCPVRQECRDVAISQGIPEGIWGGLDSQDRERIWLKAGGKPTKFMDDIDAAIGPLLQARRDFEHCDNEWSETA